MWMFWVDVIFVPHLISSDKAIDVFSLASLGHYQNNKSSTSFSNVRNSAVATCCLLNSETTVLTIEVECWLCVRQATGLLKPIYHLYYRRLNVLILKLLRGETYSVGPNILSLIFPYLT